jgi:hypothetical protein
MAEMGLFIGWGAPVRGREAKSLEVFNEAVQFYGRAQENGRIESFEVVILEPHGGDLYGFILARGSRGQINELRGDEEFQDLNVRADLIVERLGVVDAYTDDGLGAQVERFQRHVSELAS